MATINFFSKEEELPLQSASQAYGPVSAVEFRTTSLFSGSVSGSDPLAYAVGDGKVFLIQSVDNSCINLFIKPAEQIPGLPSIRYFVYRGLRKDDFLDPGTNYSTIKPQTSSDSDFIKEVRRGQNSLRCLDTFVTSADSRLLDDLFIKEEHQFHFISKGKSLGRFNTITAGLSYGFEIVLNEDGYQLSMAIARKTVNEISIPAGNTGEAELARLSILSYLDPAAFFGAFAQKDFSVKTNNTTGAKSRKKAEVYNLVSKFFTKNNVYLDIRDEFGYPIDWFATSSSNIRRTTDGTTAVNSNDNAYGNYSGYPLHLISTGFSNSETKGGERIFTIRLSLAALANATPLIALHTGLWKDFFPQFRPDFVFAKAEVVSGWTDDNAFAVIAAEEAGNYVPVSCLIKVQLTSYKELSALSNSIPVGDMHGLDLIDFGSILSPNASYVPAYDDVTVQNKIIDTL